MTEIEEIKKILVGKETSLKWSSKKRGVSDYEIERLTESVKNLTNVIRILEKHYGKES